MIELFRQYVKWKPAEKFLEKDPRSYPSHYLVAMQTVALMKKATAIFLVTSSGKFR